MKRMMFDLTGKIALVTGASRGIGKSIAATFAAHGAQVILASRKLEGLKAVEESIGRDGGKAVAIPCHTGRMEDIDRLFLESTERFGRLDILVNNAATNFYFGDVLNASEDVWEKTLAVNLKGYFFMSQRAARMMVQQGGGSIINVASVNGVRPAVLQGVYSITKAGVIAMTKSFAKELAPFNVRVNALLPGLTDTRFSSVMIENKELMEKVILPQIPMGRAGQPQEMSGAALYLASDASSYTTGTTLVVDGGILA